MKLSEATILFDLDGTLLDTYQAILESLRFATQQVLGAALPDEILIEKVGQPLIVQMESFSQSPQERDAILQAYRAHNESGLNDKMQPFEGIVEEVRRVKSLVEHVGVVTSKRRTLASYSLDCFQMYSLFECVVGLEDSEEHKPLPAPLRVAARRLTASFDTVVYVGDSPYDIQAAHAAGMPSIGVTWGKFFSRERLEAQHPTLLIDKPNELTCALQQLTA